MFAALVERDGEVRAPVETASHELCQDRFRPDLDERARACGIHRFDLLDEAHRLRDRLRKLIAHPRAVGRVARGGGIRVDRDARCTERYAVEEGAERLARGGHQRRVEGGRHGEPTRANVLRLEVALGRLDGGRRSRKDHLSRRVVIRHHHGTAPLGDQPLDGGAIGADGEHGPLACAGHQLAPPPRHRERVHFTEQPGGRERGDLAEAVTADARRQELEAIEQAQHSKARRGDRRLRRFGGGEEPLLLAPLLLGECRGREHALDNPISFCQGEIGRLIPDVAENVKVDREVATHAHVLASLSGKQEGDRPRGGTDGEVDPARRRGGRAAPLFDDFGRETKLFGEVGLIGGDDGQPRRRRGVERALRLPGEMDEGARLANALPFGATDRGERGRIRGAKEHQLARQGAHSIRMRRGPAIFLDGDVEVGAAEAERAHRGAPGMIGAAHPRASLGVEIEGALFDPQLRARRAHFYRRWQNFVMQRQHRFDEPGRSRRGLGVTNLPLHRSERAPSQRRPGLLEDRLQRFEFRQITGFGSGSVRLDQLDRVGAIACAFVGATERQRLPGRQRSVDALCAPIRRGADAADHRVHRVAVALGISEPLERQHADALAEHRAVGVFRKRAAIAGQRERSGLREAHEHEDVVEGVDAAGHHQIGAPEGQLVHRDIDRRQRACARRVDHRVGAAEVEAVGDPTGDHVAEQAGKGALLPRHVAAREHRVDSSDLRLGEPRRAHRPLDHRHLHPAHHLTDQLGRRRHAEHHAHPAAIHGFKATARRLGEHPLGHHQPEELRRIGGAQRIRRQPELERRELHLGQEATARRVDLVGRPRARIEIVAGQPVGARHVGDAVAAFEDIAPKSGGRGGAWKEGAHAHHRDRRNAEARGGGRRLVVAHGLSIGACGDRVIRRGRN